MKLLLLTTLCFSFSANIWTMRYLPTRLLTTTMTATNKKTLLNYSLPQLYQTHKIEQEKTKPLIQEIYQDVQPCDIEALNTAFLLLQQRMYLPKIFPLFLAPQLNRVTWAGEYNSNIGCITLAQTHIRYTAPTNILTVLIHELRHAQQHLAGINLGSQNKLFRKKIEHDADRFAAHTLQCVICLLIEQQLADRKKDPKGYFCKSDFEPYIQQAIANNQFCPAHAQLPKSYLYNFDCCMDHDCGKLCDRIPEKIKPLPFFSRTPKF